MLSGFFKPMKVRSVLFISLSNIGDVVLTFPVFDALCENYPQAIFSVVISPKAKSFFDEHPRVKKVHILEKQAGVKAKVKWLSDLRREKFDLVVDLRNSFLPFMVRSRHRTRPVFAGEQKGHMRDRHLRRLSTVLKGIPLARDRHALYRSGTQETSALAKLKGFRKFVMLAPGAADARKQWPVEGFSQVIRFLLSELKVPVVIVGDRKDAKIVSQHIDVENDNILNLCGQTTLKELAVCIAQARLALVNDSGIMHLASYLDIPTIALFGPTDPQLYGPWGRKSTWLRAASGRMLDITPRQVIEAIARELV